MLKSLINLTAVAIIAFWIGVITARYPLVWEILGPSAQLPQEANCTQQPTDSQSAKPAESIALSPTTPLADTPAPTSSLLPQPVGYAPASPTAQNQSAQMQMTTKNSSPPPPGLVPVPGNLFIVNDASPPAETPPAVRRLPPVCQVAPLNAGRYAAEYPQSPIPIYPHTGLR